MSVTKAIEHTIELGLQILYSKAHVSLTKVGFGVKQISPEAGNTLVMLPQLTGGGTVTMTVSLVKMSMSLAVTGMQTSSRSTI